MGRMTSGATGKACTLPVGVTVAVLGDGAPHVLVHVNDIGQADGAGQNHLAGDVRQLCMRIQQSAPQARMGVSGRADAMISGRELMPCEERRRREAQGHAPSM